MAKKGLMAKLGLPAEAWRKKIFPVLVILAHKLAHKYQEERKCDEYRKCYRMAWQKIKETLLAPGRKEEFYKAVGGSNESREAIVEKYLEQITV